MKPEEVKVYCGDKLYTKNYISLIEAKNRIRELLESPLVPYGLQHFHSEFFLNNGDYEHLYWKRPGDISSSIEIRFNPEGAKLETNEYSHFQQYKMEVTVKLYGMNCKTSTVLAHLALYRDIASFAQMIEAVCNYDIAVVTSYDPERPK